MHIESHQSSIKGKLVPREQASACCDRGPVPPSAMYATRDCASGQAIGGVMVRSKQSSSRHWLDSKRNVDKGGGGLVEKRLQVRRNVNAFRATHGSGKVPGFGGLAVV